MKRFIMMSMAIAAVVAVHAQSSVTSTLAKEAAKVCSEQRCQQSYFQRFKQCICEQSPLYCQQGQFCLQQG